MFYLNLRQLIYIRGSTTSFLSREDNMALQKCTIIYYHALFSVIFYLWHGAFFFLMTRTTGIHHTRLHMCASLEDINAKVFWNIEHSFRADERTRTRGPSVRHPEYNSPN
jgi:hypothetical protein